MAGIPKTGVTTQLTNITRGAETATAAPAFGGGGAGGARGGGGGGARGGGGGFGGGAGGGAAVSGGSQEQWLQQEQQDLFMVLRERKAKRDARNAFLKQNRDTDTIKTIGIGDKNLQGLQISPDGRL